MAEIPAAQEAREAELVERVVASYANTPDPAPGSWSRR